MKKLLFYFQIAAALIIFPIFAIILVIAFLAFYAVALSILALLPAMLMYLGVSYFNLPLSFIDCMLAMFILILLGFAIKN